MFRTGQLIAKHTLMFPVTSQHRTHQAAQFEHLRLKSRRTETEHSCLKSTEHHFPALNMTHIEHSCLKDVQANNLLLLGTAVFSEQCLVTATIQHLMHYCCITFDQLEHQTHDHCQFNNFLDNRNVHSDCEYTKRASLRKGHCQFLC